MIGCGGIAKGHLNAMKNLPARPVAMVDIDETRARQYAREYGADRYHCAAGAWDTLIMGTGGSMYITNQQIAINGEKIDIPMGPAMEAQLKEFIDAIREAREPEASGANVRKTMQALEAAKLSIARGQIIDTEDI